MAKKKRTGGGDRKTPRVVVSLPEDWHAVARRLAAKAKQPITYVFIDLLKAEAERQGIGELPAAPWERDPE